MRSGLCRARGLLGRAVWLVCALAALALAVGALLVVVKANEDNALVRAVLRLAGWADLGIFSRDDGIKRFTGDDAVVKNALFNWGIGAVVWLIVGRLVDRLIRPSE